MKKSTVLVALMLLAASTYAFQMCIGPSDAARIDSPMEKDGPAGTLTSLYAAVTRGGYIYVINPTLTDPKVAIELVRARNRGVEVRAQHQALIASVQRDNGMVHGYKAPFDAMWNDARFYEML